mmetsp:Transcript_24702/g.79877  ORF Transcript_24702/g.79877 Transcript_24702/m.79877 type:complete len:682 (+) Transcript_24702:89-2134(+)
MKEMVALLLVLRHCDAWLSPPSFFSSQTQRGVALGRRRSVFVLPAKTSGGGYFKVVTDENSTVDAFGQSTWCGIAVDETCTVDEGPIPPLDVCPAPSTPKAEERVYCSRTLNLGAVKVVGYDMDYTVVHYKWRKWEAEAYSCAKDVLKGFGFPVKDLEFDDPDLVCRGLVIDKTRGNFLKIDRHGFVRRAMHGRRRLSEIEIDEHYGRTRVDLRENSRYQFLNTLFSVSEGVLYSQLVQKLDSGALFDEANAPFDATKCESYADLHRAVSKALERAHTNQSSRLKDTVAANPEAFTQRDAAKLRATLRDQRAAGKKLALITNSDYKYTDTMMSFVLGDDPDWRAFFDVVFVSARKPGFFTTEPVPCYELILEKGNGERRRPGGAGLDDFDYGERDYYSRNNNNHHHHREGEGEDEDEDFGVGEKNDDHHHEEEDHEDGKKTTTSHRGGKGGFGFAVDWQPLLRQTVRAVEGGVYCGGSARYVEKLFGVSADEVLYVGDHVFVDANAVKQSMRWRTALVVQELEPEIQALSKEHDRRRELDVLLGRKALLTTTLDGLRCHLRRFEDNADAADGLIQHEADADLCRRHMAKLVRDVDDLEDLITPAVRTEGDNFNKYWGFISKAGHDKSSFQRQIEKYADIYTARVTNLLPYTPYHYFRAFATRLAHDPDVYDDLIDASEICI